MTRASAATSMRVANLLALQNELWSLIREEAIDAEPRSSMLDRAPSKDTRQDELKPRPVAFRGAGFYPERGTLFRWIAFAAGDRVLATRRAAPVGQSAVLPPPSAIALAIYKARAVRARSGSILSWSVMRIGSAGFWYCGRVIVGFRNRAIDAGARRRLYLHLGTVSDSEDGAAALLNPGGFGIGERTQDRTNVRSAVFFSTAISGL